jgi:alpha-L-fucosidase 2
LQALFFQYGRYLLIAGSRADSPLPTHLQGIWNDNGAANMSWSCDYHININMEQNYWPTETCNLAECGVPLFHLVESLTVPGHAMARAVYGIDKGWACFWSTNAWGSIPSGESGWGFEIVGGVWVATHLWEHYAFTGDRRFLAAEAYPVLKGAAEFFLAYLFPDPKTGYLLSGPSGSPERGFNGPSPTHDTALITALFEEVIAGSKILGVDADLRARVQAALGKLPPYKIGRNGQLQEWLTVDDGGETNHRHTSHLVGLFPLGDISPRKTPELAAAAARSLSLRMDRPDFEDVEWSRANAICYQARLGDGEKAEESVVVLTRKLTRADLLTVTVSGVAGAQEDIFCVDGNEAGTAGMAEMLLQSQDGGIELLPALPGKEWPQGLVTGLCARGGYEVSEQWRNGKLVGATIHSTWGGPTTVRYGEKVVRLEIKPGETKVLDGDLRSSIALK